MLSALLGLHVAGMIAAVLIGRRSLRPSLAAAGVAPALTAIWAAKQLITDAAPVTSEWVWVEGLDLGYRFQTDTFALMMTLLVSGIGAGVFVYAVGYFSPAAAGGPWFPATLLAFSAAMVGLVWSDSVWTLFIFWELTSVTSFLLVGYKNTDATARAAARRALMITGAGGLILLAGLLLLTGLEGTAHLSDIGPVTGSRASWAAALIVIGAATKSAQLPFHVWLPGAMAAPTPVSAYLHSATMVKAGIVLLAVLSPALGQNETWRWLGLAFGVSSLVWGAIGALRQRDAKLILAWGTVSQLGLMFTLLVAGSAKATFAAIGMIVAHAIFKAALFQVVGEVDVRTGTRSIDQLGGLARSMPVAFGVAVVSGLSMAGAPPLLGFMTKEAAVEAALKLTGAEQIIVLGAVVGGSILTVAYTFRFLWGTFGPGPATKVAPRRLAMTIPSVTLAGLSVAGYVAAGPVSGLVGSAATELDPDASKYELLPWPGLTTAFMVSVGILAGGTALGWVLSRRTIRVPEPLGAEAADQGIDGVLRLAPRITAEVQHGSLPVYLVTMIGAALAALVPFTTQIDTDHLYLWEGPLQGLAAMALVISAFATGFVASRLGAALALGAVGIAVTGLFVIQGAPDLALTQIIVETVIVVGFVLGLGVLGRQFPRANRSWRLIRLAVAVLGGIGVMVALVAAGSKPSGSPPLAELEVAAVDEGGGANIVNVILTDIRALDTLGEVVVLAVVAVGILALARVQRAEATT